jgi:hypothetical protein
LNVSAASALCKSASQWLAQSAVKFLFLTEAAEPPDLAVKQPQNHFSSDDYFGSGHFSLGEFHPGSARKRPC